MTDEDDAVRKARDEGHLTILAHPWCYEPGAEDLWTGPPPDAIEGLSNKSAVTPQQAAQAVARWPRLPRVHAADVHPLTHINRFWIETSRRVVDADDIRDIVLAGDYVTAQADRPVVDHSSALNPDAENAP